MRAISIPLFVLALCACGPYGCGPGAPPPKAAEPEPAASSDAPPKGSVYGGTLAPVDVKKALVARKEDVKACYHALLEKNNKASGKVVLRFTVGEDGVVEEVVTMNGTSLPDETAKCIGDVVKSIKFPKPSGGKATITYPWEFTAE